MFDAMLGQIRASEVLPVKGGPKVSDWVTILARHLLQLLNET